MDVLLINMDDYIPIFRFFRFYYINIQSLKPNVHTAGELHMCVLIACLEMHMFQYVQRKLAWQENDNRKLYLGVSLSKWVQA